MSRLNVILALLPLLACARPRVTVAQKLEPGGSNYYAYYVTPKYLAPCPCRPPYDDTNPDWLMWQREAYLPGAFEHVVAGYHHHPEVVRQQLREMYAAGQRKIGLLLHLVMSIHECFGLETPPDVCHTTHAYSGDGSWGFAIPVDSTTYELRPQHLKNLKNIISDLREIGFNQVNIRFSTFGENDPRGYRDAAPPRPKWDDYHTLLYERYWRALRSTIDSVNIWAPEGGPLAVLYDLNVEFSAYLRERDGKPWNSKYSYGHTIEHARRLWRDYLARYGNNRTIGFSFGGVLHPLAKDWRIREIVTDVNRVVYDVVGERPKLYGFDIYGTGPGPYAGLDGCKYPCYEKYFEEIARQIRRDKTHPVPQVLIMESSYQDSAFGRAVKWANEKLGLKIPYVMQWPARPTPWNAHITVQFPRDYDAYLWLSQ